MVVKIKIKKRLLKHLQENGFKAKPSENHNDGVNFVYFSKNVETTDKAAEIVRSIEAEFNPEDHGYNSMIWDLEGTCKEFAANVAFCFDA